MGVYRKMRTYTVEVFGNDTVPLREETGSDDEPEAQAGGVLHAVYAIPVSQTSVRFTLNDENGIDIMDGLGTSSAITALRLFMADEVGGNPAYGALSITTSTAAIPAGSIIFVVSVRE